MNSVKETKAKLTESYPVCHKGCIGYMKECKTSYVEDGDITNAVKAKEKEKQPKRTVVPGEVEVEVSTTKENTRLESVADTTQSSKSGKKRGCCPIM